MLLPFNLLGQTLGLFGNEWVNIDRSYYKFYTAEKGIYQITYSNLKDAGIPIDSINPKSLQLFHNGLEIPIHVEGEKDNSFDTADFILFYGNYNDGSLDKPLYQDTAQQTNPYQSLYTDSTA